MTPRSAAHPFATAGRVAAASRGTPPAARPARGGWSIGAASARAPAFLGGILGIAILILYGVFIIVVQIKNLVWLLT